MSEFCSITKKMKKDQEITGGYCGDLLSWVMAHAKKGNIWITVQTHINIIAIATLLELTCIIIPENISVEKETIQKAEQEQIPILGSNLTSFEIANLLGKRGL